MPERKMRADAAASTQMGTQRQGGRAGAHLTQISPLRPYQAREGGTIYMISTPKPFDRSEGAKRDIIAGGIVVAAILLFVGTGSNVMQADRKSVVEGKSVSVSVDLGGRRINKKKKKKK